MTTWTLTPSWPKPPLNMNQRLHRMAEYEQQQTIRQTAKILARNAKIPPCQHVEVAMIWTVPDRGRRDAENPVATMKPFCDGLVDAGIVPDDVPEFMTKLMPVIRYVKGRHGVRFVVRSIETADASCPASPVPDEKQTGVSLVPRATPGALRRSGGDAA